MTTRWIVLSLYALSAYVTSAQQTTNPTDDKSQFATLEGRTLGMGGAPLRKTSVTLRPADAAPGAINLGGPVSSPQPGTFVATSDAEGKFHFDRLPPGRYYLVGEHIGYLRTGLGAKRPYVQGTVITLAAGKTTSDIALEMMPAAVISGKILDEDGDPIPQATIRLSQIVYRNGKRQMQMTGMRTADSAGEFRLDNTAPGKYWLSASKRGMMFFMGNDGPVKDASLKPGEQEQDYVTTYYPGVLEESAAQPITVVGGQDLPGTNITLKKKAVFHIRGKVVGMIPGKPLSTLRVSASEADNQMGMMMVGGPGSSNIGKDGTFDLSAFPAGSYVASVTTSSGMIQTLARQKIQLGNQDLNELTLSLQPLAEVTGVVQIEGEQQDDAATAQNKASGKNVDALPKIRVALNAVDQIGGGLQQQTVKDDGTFTFPDVAAGKFRLNVMGTPPGSYVSSVRLGGQDAMADGFDVSSGQVKLDVKISMNAGQISGKVTDGTNAAGGATVTLIPEPANPEWSWLYRTATADQTGNFTFKNIAPGKYRVYAWEDLEPGANQDPELLKPWTSKSAEVTVKEKSQETATLVRISKADLAGRQ